MQRVDHVMDPILVGAILIAPFYIVYKLGMYIIH